MSDKLRVLILVKGLGLGGAERLLSESVPYLDRESIDYEIAYLTPWKDDLVPAFEQASIPVHCLDIGNELDPRAAIRLQRLLRDRRVDLVHSHSPYPSVLARLLAPLTGSPAIVHTEHSLPDSRRAVTQLANRLTYRLTDCVIAVSANVKAGIESGGWLKPHFIEVVHGGVDDRLLSPVDEELVRVTRNELGVDPESFVVGNVAHLRSQKGHTVFLEAAKLIIEEEPDTTFVLVGREKEPGFLDELKAQAAALGIGDRVIFAGFRPNPFPILASLDLFMMTSLYEGFPIALVEAMAVGLAIVATDVGGVGEAIQSGVEGLLVPPRDPHALADAALRLLRDPAERMLLSGHARTRVAAEFTLESMVRRVESLYRDTLS